MLRSRVRLSANAGPMDSSVRGRLRLGVTGPSASLRTCAFGVTGAGGGAFSRAITEQRRFSFKYAKKSQMDEMRQPSFIHDKRYGIFSDEHNKGKSRRGLPYITPLYTKHMSLWETDTDASTNRFFRSYVFGQRELHQLLGRQHGFEADEAGGKQSDSAYELATDQRYKGITRPAITNLHYEPEWNYTLYRNGAQGSQLTNPRSPFTEEVLGPELVKVRDIKSLEDCKAWFGRLQYLIKLHHDAVGDIGEFKSRHTQHVHEFFVMFHDALSSFDFQDGYLFGQFAKARPPELEDLFGIFLEMEANYINEDYCPRCSLPTATTRYCGEGDPNTPFRKHRGRWAPHQRWGREWFDVVVRRAEALWYRSTEDPYFGTEEHTQRQVEGMFSVYIKAKQRAKAIDFVNAIHGSKEFLLGRVTITAEMQHQLDHLFDTTPHQHLPTNGFSVQSKAAVYTGETNKVPHSPLQLRIDLEKQKYRRQQKEEGVVRVPPALWKLDTSAIVPYRLDANKRVTNWREVKTGIEKSFLSTGLPKEAYTSEEWREMLYWRDHMAGRAQRRAELEAQRQTEEAKAKSTGKAFIIFPDKDWYRVFDTSAEALKAFGISGGAGMVFTASAPVLANPAEVSLKDPVSGADLRIDTTDEACKVYGDFQSGDVVRLTPRTDAGATAGGEEVVIVGVNKTGAEGDWSLLASPRRGGAEGKGLVELGKDCVDIKDKYEAVQRTGLKAAVPLLEAEKKVKEEFLGQIVGVREGQLYVQWRLLKGGGSSALDRSVAVCLGPKDLFASQYSCRELSAEPLVEPSSWRTPFRNEFAEERLTELEKAPFSREQWASLIKGKYTPKPKKFGYTQHTTQDDFETKEYKDRVLARQYFHDPQAFEVLPERKEKSVRFEGKWAYQRTHGLPTVDRNELENGWSEQEPVSDMEVDVIEQALRDISGRRPGNFVKHPSETQSLRLNESWWAPLGFGWEEHNRQQKAFLDSTEQQLVESSRLPFGGRVPPFGTSYGIGERIRDIAADYAKGFGLGPHGHSPGHSTAAFNTLGAEEARVRTLGLGNPLVRLFDEKLGDTDPAAWALQQSGRDDANVKQLLLSLHEWREKGRAPSLLLATVLGRYLEKEISMFNQGLPAGVPHLSVEAESRNTAASQTTNGTGGSGDPAAPAKRASGNIWSDVDSTRYAYEHAQMRDRGDSGEAYIPGLIQRANLGGNQANFPDANYTSFLQQDVLATFQLELAKIVGRGVPAGVIAQRSAEAAKSNPRAGGTVVQFVKVSELAALLRRMRVSSENVSVVERGLANCPEHLRLDGTDGLVVPVSLVFAWGGPTATAAVAHTSPSAPAPSPHRHSNSDTLSRAVHSATAGARGASSGGRGDGKMVVHILEELALRHDGLAMDIKYAIRENRRNPVLRQEFFNAFLPVCGKGHAQVAEFYEMYCEGRYVPNITVAFEIFTHFLANLSAKPESIPTAVDYFAVNTTGRHPDEYTQLELLPPTVGPFQFDSTKTEAIETMELFKKYGIIAGPVRVAPTRFLPAKSQSISYFSQQRQDDTVRVTMKNDEGLRQALEKSPQWAVISANPKLRFILKSQGALVSSFNRYFQRVTPMLNLYMGVLAEYNDTVQSLRFNAQNANRGLARVLENEMAPSVEQDFRRNAERYWRNVLDGRHGRDDTVMGGGSSGSAAAAGGGSGAVGGHTQGLPQPRQQWRPQSSPQRDRGRGAGRTGEEGSGSPRSLDRALGLKPQQQQQQRSAGAGSGARGPRPGSSAGSQQSTADRLGNVLGVVSKGGVAKKPGGGGSGSGSSAGLSSAAGQRKRQT